MFETAILEDRGTKSRVWTMAAASLQFGLVGVVLLIPLMTPDRLRILVKQATIALQPLREAPPVQPSPSSAPHSQAPVLSMAPAFARVLVAPGPNIKPVATIIDDPSSYGPPAINIAGNGQGSYVPFSTGSFEGTTPPPPPPPAPKQVVKPAEPTDPVRVGGNVLEAKIIKRAIPLYPPLAKQARISGVVRLEGIIAKDGTIQKLRVLAGHPLLVTAALEAVRQWVYSPTQLNGQAVEVIAPIDVNFILN